MHLYEDQKRETLSNYCSKQEQGSGNPLGHLLAFCFFFNCLSCKAGVANYLKAKEPIKTISITTLLA